MKVKQLKEILNNHPDDMEVIYMACSDYNELDAEEIEVVRAVPKGFYVMRSHPTMSKENLKKEQEMLCFPGN